VGDRSGGSFYNRGADVIQDYEKIRSKCLENGELFEDPEFPAEDPSVFFSRSERRSFQWLRPHVSIIANISPMLKSLQDQSFKIPFGFFAGDT